MERLTDIIKQIGKEYNHDLFIRERTLNDIEIPEIKDQLRDRMPRTAQKIVKWAVRILSDKPKTAVTEGVQYTDHETDIRNVCEDEEPPHANYPLGKQYGGRIRVISNPTAQINHKTADLKTPVKEDDWEEA